MEEEVPLAGKLITPLGELPLQVYVVPVKDDVRLTALVAEPLQTVCIKGLLVIVGIGFTVTVTEAEALQFVVVLVPTTV